MPKTLDIRGQKFGRLTALNFSHKIGYNHYWNCICKCGNEKTFQKGSLISGNTKSCGCLRKEKVTKHGMRYTRLYKILDGMKRRCCEKQYPDYKNYGGRGITICDEWKNNIKVFNDWAMANGYEEHLSIDRIDNDGNYEPSNCRWITNKEQQRNKRSNHFVTYNGQTKCLSEWAEILKINYKALRTRIRNGWDAETALQQGHTEILTINRNKYERCK